MVDSFVFLKENFKRNERIIIAEVQGYLTT